MVRQYKKYQDDDVIKNSLKVNSLAELLRSLDLKIAGGNYAHMKKTLQRLNVDCSHWTGAAWSKNKRLKDWSDYSSVNYLKIHLIKERGHKCERCNLEKWEEMPIPIEVDHIDGDRTNNKEKNLKLLCCNCHSLTSTWRGRKNKIKEKTYCSECDKEINRYSKSNKCRSCFNKTRIYSDIKRKVKNRPSKKALLKEIEETSYCAIGRKYGVSDNAIRKWLI